MYEAEKISSVDTPSPPFWKPRGLAELARLVFWEARPIVQGIFLLRLLTGASLSGSAHPLGFGVESVAPLVVLAASWTCVTSAAYIYNGVQDVEEDRENGSERPIACGKLSVRQAMVMIGGLGALGLLGGILVHRELVWALAAIAIMGWLYSGPPLHLKRWPVALAVMAAISAILTYYAGYSASGGGEVGMPFFIFSGGMALWMGLVGQSKDFSDVPGDEKAGRKSLPIVWGENAARLTVSGIALILGLGFLSSSFFLAEGLLPAAAAVCIGACIFATFSIGPWGRGSRNRCRRPYKAFMITQYTAHAVIIFIAVDI